MIKIIFVICCLLLNAVFSAIEMALVSLNLPQIKLLARQGDLKAAKILRYRENPERTLSILQVGITLVGAISAALGGAGAQEILSPYLMTHFSLSQHTSDAVAIAMVILPLTYLSVTMGELVPKTIALRHSLPVARMGVPFLMVMDKLFSPFIWVLESSTRRLLRFVRLPRSQTVPKPTDELTAQHQQYVINMVDLEKKRVYDITVPWEKANTVHVTQDLNKITEIVLRSGHTRLPVCDDQNVVGVLHTKEFMAFREAGAEDWKSIIRPILKVKEGDPLIKALRLMQSSRRHMALVISHDDKLMGIITLEDILEEIVGDIYDEDDDGSVRAILAASAALKLRPYNKS